MTRIFEFRYSPSDNIFFTNSKPNKRLNQKTKIFVGTVYPLPKSLLEGKHIVKTSNSLKSNNRILFSIVVKMISLNVSLQNVYQKHQK